MDFWVSGVVQGLCYGLLSLGIYITFRIYNFPDITADGSIALGASIASIMLINGFPPHFSLLMASIGGFLAGVSTGLINTKLRINALLSGILVTTSIYTINLWIMGRSNIPLISQEVIFTFPKEIFSFLGKRFPELIYVFAFDIIFVILIALLFKTDFGLAMRATGDNETMITAQGTNVHVMKIFGIGFANALIAISGAVVAQYQGYSDVNMGIGTIVYGLASVIIGEGVAKLFFRNPSIGANLFFVLIGSAIFRTLVAAAINFGFNNEIKLITSLLVLLSVGITQLRDRK